METKPVRPWYKKKRYLIPLGILALLFVLGGSDSSSNNNGSSKTTTVQQASQAATLNSLTQPQAPTVAPKTEYQATTKVDSGSIYTAPGHTTDVPLSNDNYYTNSKGNEVHSPAYAPSAPAGASAVCRDGTYSFSQSRRGTCSHHGGVARWL